MKSKLFNLNGRDFVDGAASAVIVAVVAGLYGLIQSDFSLFTADWVTIGKNMADWAAAGFIGYIGNVFLSNEDGKILGAI